MTKSLQGIDLEKYTLPENALAERVILVTGAGSGLGRAAALAFARGGAQVLLLGRTVGKLEAVYDEILAQGSPRPSIVPLDFGKAQREQYQAVADAIENEHGRLDGILHSAAILEGLMPLEQHDVGRWQKTLHVNLTAPFVLTQCLAPLLRASADASVIFTSSAVGRRGKAFWGAYAVSKFGIEGLAQVLADEWANQPHLRVNCINPGAVGTALRRRAYPAEDAEQLKAPEEVLGPYLFLMGPDGRGISGHSVDCQPAAARRDPLSPTT